jgi:excisionase family DNA binding protein
MQTFPDSQQFFNLQEAAAYLRMKERALRDACLAKRIGYAKLDRRTWRFTRAGLDDFIRRNSFEPRTLYGPKAAKR